MCNTTLYFLELLYTKREVLSLVFSLTSTHKSEESLGWLSRRNAVLRADVASGLAWISLASQL